MAMQRPVEPSYAGSNPVSHPLEIHSLQVCDVNESIEVSKISDPGSRPGRSAIVLWCNRQTHRALTPEL